MVFCGTALFCILNAKALSKDFTTGISSIAAKELKDGSIQKNYVVKEYVLSCLEVAEDGTDVSIVVPVNATSDALYGMGLLPEADSFVNVSAAGLYNLNSVSVTYDYE
ncbi:hypothetical protein [Butyrivibrio sp. NC2002]|uniref:hypothetical protein n=1 Tax=Butyrivibrio sp. NC2002 TaxID=1410610 RepID=UPI000562B139|nr:hypothetical protein [Butyrivibrio sp. NC2002]